MWKTTFCREKKRKKVDHKSVSIDEIVCQKNVNGK